jgi:hypothetical protein
MNKTHELCRLASERGFFIDKDGDLNGPVNGKLVGSLKGKEGEPSYMYLSIHYNGKKNKIPVHRLIAYLKYGDRAFGVGMVTRHLDGDSLNNKEWNIAIGTQRDNIMDRPMSDRVSHSMRANSFKKVRMTMDQKKDILSRYSSGESQASIAKELGLKRSTIGYFIRQGKKPPCFYS